MKAASVIIAVAVILLLPAQTLAVSEHLEYNISVNKHGSAFWTIIHVTDIDSPVDSWEDFEQKIIATINNAEDNTGREMTLDFSSLEMSTQINWETSSKTISYIFSWQNFSIVEEECITFGDIFDKNFFPFLYGDGELYIAYPSEYVLTSISSNANQHDNYTHTLHWYRTQDFLYVPQTISLEAAKIKYNTDPYLFTLAILGPGSLGILAIAFFALKQRRQKQKLKLSEFPSYQEIESDQEKVLRLLKSSGGNLKQSEVCNKLRFSRAKTSLLLAEMEKNNLVRRCKKGKNKIVFQTANKEGRDF